MNSINNQLIRYKTITEINDEAKTNFFKLIIKRNTEGYNETKEFLKNSSDEKSIKYYNISIKICMSKVLLFNSILRKDKENIIKNFDNYNKYQLDYMESMEEISEDDKDSIDYYINEDGEIIKTGEHYRLECIEIKNSYELIKYIIEKDYK